ncbi:MAG: DUF4417 domain-containing protein [Oscillospiraceae bacterium]|nr:DUF4417 domain-containing protein [Oscillospiraceae bacterium]
MSKINSTRSGCKDVFRAFLVKNAHFDSDLEIPCIVPESSLPERMIPFSKAISNTDYDQWVHFYEDDAKFERIWNNPEKYLPILKKFKGAISPDFSLYRDMPLVMQQWNIYRGRAIGHWLQENGIPVIPNIRYGDSRTYPLSCAGVTKGGSIAVGSHGCIKLVRERKYFAQGLAYVVKTLEPKAIVVYGTAPDSVFGEYRRAGITIIQFDSDYAVSHDKAVST